MTCNVRTNSVNKLIEKGAIDSSMTVVDRELFDELNQIYSDRARETYGVKDEGLLFSKQLKEVPRLGAPVYNREDTKTVTKAVGNDEMFKELQENFNKQSGQSLQLDSVPASKAPKELVEKMKAAGKQMGIDFQKLADYAKKTGLNVTNVNGVADLVHGIVAIAEGREDQTLLEEMVHLASAIVNETDPQVITSLISQISKYKIYDVVLKEYRDRPEYQINGKPDLRKIKKEAVDKLIVELIINQSEGSTDFPELMELKERNAVQRMWDSILQAIRRLRQKSNIDLFGETAARIGAGEVGGTVSDIKGGGIFLQTKQKEAIDKYYDQIIDKDSRLKIILETKDASGKVIKKRHRTFDGKDVAKSVTEKAKEGGKEFDKPTPENQVKYDQMKDWGSVGHEFLKDVFDNELLDPSGYAKAEATPTNIKTTLNPALQKVIRSFAKELINSYPAGTRFIIERQVINEKEDIASTVDFKALIPNIDPKTSDKIPFYIDTLDWKFTTLNKEQYTDIPFYRQKEWKIQMGEYGKMDIAYGAKPEQLKKSRMIQFIANYEAKEKGVKGSPLDLTALEIGNLDNVKETKIYLLPVALDTESTGNKKIDELVTSLKSYYEKLYIAPVKEGKLFIKKKLDLERLSNSIRSLQMQLSFDPLYNVTKTFLNNAAESFKSFENIDYDSLTGEQIQDKLQDLYQLGNSAEKFTTLDEVFLTKFPSDNLSDKDKVTLKNLREAARATQRMEEKILNLSREYVKWIALKVGAVDLGFEQEAINAEIEVDNLSKTFLEGSKLSPIVSKAATNLMMKAKSLVDIKANRMMNGFAKLLAPLQEAANAAGKSAFDLIGKVEKDNLTLIKKIDSKFLEEVDKAKADKDKKFLLDNMDLAKYNALAKSAIDDEVSEINKTVYSTNADDNYDIQQARIKDLRNRLDINRDTFNGYTNYQFKKLYEKVVKEELHYSDEYKQMSKTKAALDMWEFFTELNNKAVSMGYLSKQGLSFFPLMEATLLQKFSQSGSPLEQLKDFFKDMYTVKINEEETFSKTDPETGELKRAIPKLFTRTNKAVEQLSQDLNKVGTMWIYSLLNYESTKELEYTLLTLQKVEDAKESLLLDPNKNVIMEGGVPKSIVNNNRNSGVLKAMIDDYLYGYNEDLNSFGNLTLNTITGKFKTGEEQEKRNLSIKKGIKSLEKWVQASAVGLKPLIATANTFGFNFNAFINAGNKMKSFEVTKNAGKIISGLGLTTIDKGLLDLVIPLNEDIVKEKMRKIAKGESYVKWLGTWNFSDVMMSTNAFPEKRMQLATGLSFNDNSMVENGKIVNIRQFVSTEDRAVKYKMSQQDREALEATYEARVKKLQETRSLPKIAKIENDEVIIPGVSDEALAEYRVEILDYIRKLNGQMSQENKAGYSRDTIFKSFMMFRTWIPKFVSERSLDIHKNIEQGDWEYGRIRAFAKTWAHLGFTNILKMRQIINATDEGLKIMDDMLEAKKAAYLKKHGKELHISSEEFYDMMRKELSNEMKELGLLLGLMGLWLSAKAAAPPDDADALERNRYKYFVKGINKIVDEVSFYYNPLSFEAITKGNIVPALSILTKAEKIVAQILKESYGTVVGDEKMVEKAHPTKYILDFIPGPSQFQSEILPYVFPEIAKDWGVRVTSQARQ